MREDPYNVSNDPFVQNEQGEVNQRRTMLLSLLRGRWHWAILLAVLLATAGGYLGYNSQPDMYQAQSFIDIKLGYTDSPIEIKDPSLYEPYVNFVNGEMRRLRSLEVLENAMGQPEWQEHLATRSDDLPEVTLDDFSSSINFSEPGKNETILYVRYEDTDPNTARAGLNALLAAYDENQEEDQSTVMRDNVRILTDRLRELEVEKSSIEQQIKQVIPDDSVDNIRQRRNILQSQLFSFESRLDDIDLILKPFLDLQQNASSDSIREIMLRDPQMQELLGRKAELDQLIAHYIEVLNYGDSNRLVVQTRKQLAQVDRRISELEASWLENGDAEIQRKLPQAIVELQAQRKVVLEKVEELSQKTADLSTKLGAIAELERKREETYNRIISAKDQIDKLNLSIELLGKGDASRIEVGPPASTPSTPWNAGKRRQMAGVGAIGGFFVGFGMVMMVGLLDRRLRHVSDTAAGMPDTNVLGILPTLPANLTDPEDAETAAHCVHHIRTLLQIGGSNRVFSITSPAAGSGKSSLATALGMSFAASGTRTLVIDCDLVGAGLSRRMGTVVHEPLDVVIRRHGMIDEASLARALTISTSTERPLDEVLVSEGLMDEEQIESAIRLQRDTALGVLDACSPSRLRSCVAVTGIENFYILPVGKARPSDASRLSPAAIREMVRQAREAFDIVLIDTGPVLGSLEASIAAAEADATILIVSRGDQKSLASRTLEQLRSVRANIAGVVFNHALERDLDHTSYASVISQERRPTRSARKQRLDQTRSARLGPLGTAVASYSDEEETTSHNGSHANGHSTELEGGTD